MTPDQLLKITDRLRAEEWHRKSPRTKEEWMALQALKLKRRRKFHIYGSFIMFVITSFVIWKLF